MAECADKNMIDKDEYPQTAELELRCVTMLADLWDVAGPGHGHGLLDHRLERGLHARRDGPQVALARAPPAEPARRADAQPGHGHERPGVLGEVLPPTGRSSRAWCRWRATGLHLNAEEAVALRREHHRRRRHPGLDLRRHLRAGRPRSPTRSTTCRSGPASTCRSTSTAPPAASSRRSSTRTSVGLPAAARAVDQRLGPQVRPGLPGRRLGDLARRRRPARGPGLPGQLPGRRHADLRPQLLPPRAPRWSRSTTTSCGSASTGYAGVQQACRDVGR